jgi:hypothetical protein
LEDESVIELDSSTESKFSRHVIIRLPGLAFANNRHVGAFVQCMLQNAQDDRRTGGASLLVKAVMPLCILMVLSSLHSSMILNVFAEITKQFWMPILELPPKLF